MSVKLPSYPKYKDSGVKWLGDVPEHWDTSVLKRMVHLELSNIDKKTAEGEISVKLCNYLDVYRNQTITANLDFMAASASKEQIARLSLRQGDVIITKDSETPDDIGVPALVADNMDGVVCGYHLALLRVYPCIANGPYVARTLQSAFVHAQFSASAVGITRFALGKYEIENAIVPKPTIEEQMKIAEFLERETEKIDALVEEQQRLVELLKEKRQAAISHAVTKGLNPDAPMKESGVKWLGEVPEHWSVAPVAYRYSVQLGKMLDSSKITGEHLRPYLRVFDVQWGEINTDGLPQMDFHEDARKRFRLMPGDLLVNEGGSYPGRCAIWSLESFECYYQKALHRMRPHRPDEDTTRFLFYVMSWAANQGVFVAGGNETTIEHLPAEKLRRYRFAFPPMTEQDAIASCLDAELVTFNEQTSAAAHLISLLQERRSALISAAVTGQIDVRTYRSEASNIVVLPTRKASPEFVRTVLAAEIVYQLHLEPTFGHVKFQKIFHLAQYYAEIEDFDSNYTRQAAGPFDHGLVKSVERQMRNAKWYDCQRDGGRYYFSPMEKAGGHDGYFTSYYGAKRDKIQRIIDLCRKMTTEQCEIVSTLYGAWNDLLLAGSAFTDDVIVQEVLTHWHSAKERIDESRWKRALGWMRDHDLAPKGKGKPIKTRAAEGRA